jgi:hypothetical protein
MNFQDIFATYYTQFRGDSEVPETSDPEWTTAIRLANTAIAVWRNVDGVLWNELWSKNSEGDGSTSLAEGELSYDAPSDFYRPGGFIRLRDGDNNVVDYVKVIDPSEAQANVGGMYAYFSGSPNLSTQLTFGTAPVASQDGLTIDYDYYRQPTMITDGDSQPDMADPYFIVHRMLADRFRASRNPTGYQTASRDADIALQNMIQRNSMGAPYSGWQIPDFNTGVFGT